MCRRLLTQATAPTCLYKSFFIQEILKEAWKRCMHVVLEVERMAAGGDEDTKCDKDVGRTHSNGNGKQREDLPAGEETPPLSPPATLDSDDNRKLWKSLLHTGGADISSGKKPAKVTCDTSEVVEVYAARVPATLAENKEGTGEAEDMEDESHEDADPFHRRRDVRHGSLEADAGPLSVPERLKVPDMLSYNLGSS